jgi:acid phosphatase
MPKLLSDSDIIYVRSTLVPRALESVQQALLGLYPPDMRTPGFPPLTITMRIAAAETLYPNNKACRRLAELSRAFARRAAKRWNDTEDMKYVNDKIGKWMPANSKVAVDSRPRLSGIMDTIKTSLAHGPATRLPEEFYDKKLGDIINRIVIDEWFQGFSVSREYRMLGVGSLAGDILSRMIDSVEGNQRVDNAAGGGDLYAGQSHSEEKHFKFALLGCHDTTIGGMLASLGCLDGDKWPPFTSHIAFELFRKNSSASRSHGQTQHLAAGTTGVECGQNSHVAMSEIRQSPYAQGIGRRPVEKLTSAEKRSLDGYYVRIRYNDQVMTIPGCRPKGRHLEGDNSFCTLVSPLIVLLLPHSLNVKQEAFKSIVDKYTPKNWRYACSSNLGSSAVPSSAEPSGY